MCGGVSQVVLGILLFYIHSDHCGIWVSLLELFFGIPGLGPISHSPFLSLWVFLIHPLPFPLITFFLSVSILSIEVVYSSSDNGFVSASCNTLKVFSVFMLLSLIIFLCLSFCF